MISFTKKLHDIQIKTETNLQTDVHQRLKITFKDTKLPHPTIVEATCGLHNCVQMANFDLASTKD